MRFEAEQQEFINIVNESFRTLVSHYNVELPVSEIAYRMNTSRMM